MRAYRESHGARRAAAERAALDRSRERGELPAEADLDALQQILGGAVLHHLGAFPDTVTAGEVKSYLVAMLRQTGYRPRA
ncbi:TetR/AcrR family transcriptional regulator C-terminal ligand-binding domain-containing protein [Nonomuraea sp. NPDC050691]|uniref:TetR/AcrR family transcriptional regulator C-terminal ligand-binding domain-containing protein n=1 Tax=Nonomuraea sp. NPDC050691 TaxID=3155661 RepID=UPI0033DAE1B0